MASEQLVRRLQQALEGCKRVLKAPTDVVIAVIKHSSAKRGTAYISLEALPSANPDHEWMKLIVQLGPRTNGDEAAILLGKIHDAFLYEAAFNAGAIVSPLSVTYDHLFELTTALEPGSLPIDEKILSTMAEAFEEDGDLDEETTRVQIRHGKCKEAFMHLNNELHQLHLQTREARYAIDYNARLVDQRYPDWDEQSEERKKIVVHKLITKALDKHDLHNMSISDYQQRWRFIGALYVYEQNWEMKWALRDLATLRSDLRTNMRMAWDDLEDEIREQEHDEKLNDHLLARRPAVDPTRI